MEDQPNFTLNTERMTLKFILPKISHMVAVYFLFVYFHQSYGHPSPIPSNRSMDYKWELLSEFSLALIGIILNSIGMNLLLTLDSEGRDSMTFYSLNVALSAVDMTCLLTRVASIISVLYYHGYYGGNSGITCSLSAMFIAICAFWSISIVVGISYVAKHNLYIEKKLTQKDMCIWVAVSGTVATAITFAGAYVPDGGFGMDSSGTFCFLKLYSYTSATIYFGVGLTIIYGVLARNLILIYQAVQKSQQILKQHSINSYAKSSYIKMLVKLSYFYIGMHISFIPVLINFIYEISQQDYIDPQYSTFCALFSTLNPSLVNPILLFLLNYRIRYQFKQKYSYIYDTFIKIKRFIIMGSNRSRVGSVLLNSPVKYCYQMENWMTDPTLWSFFVEYGKKHYVVENLLFYDDVRRYRALGDEILQLIQNRLGDCVASKWTDLERHAIRIYTVYIEVSNSKSVHLIILLFIF